MYEKAATKTTFILADSRRARLKALAAERGVTVTELLAEGADLVIEKYRGLSDREQLSRRAREAKDRLRAGLYSGPSVSSNADDVVYARSGRGLRK